MARRNTTEVVDETDTEYGDNADEYEFGSQPVPLADAALTALGDMAAGDGIQTAFEGMDDVTKVRFTGMAFDSIDDRIQLGDELTFLVRARCIAETKEVLKDGGTRNIRRMDVQSVVVKED